MVVHITLAPRATMGAAGFVAVLTPVLSSRRRLAAGGRLYYGRGAVVSASVLVADWQTVVQCRRVVLPRCAVCCNANASSVRALAVGRWRGFRFRASSPTSLHFACSSALAAGRRASSVHLYPGPA